MIKLGARLLTINDVIQVSKFNKKCEIANEGLVRIQVSNDRLNRILKTGKAVYGINTGYGVFSDKKIKNEEIELLNRNLILSHAVGTGTPLDHDIVRAAMLVRANTLTTGYSGIRVEVVQTIVDTLNKEVTPIIPSQGSLGSSGDLCPLSHLALVLTTDRNDHENESGIAIYKGVQYSGKEAMLKAGIKRIILGPKEGLAINNGATFSAAIMALALYEARYLLNLADKATSLSLEGLRGSPDAFDERIHSARGLNGQIQSAKNIKDYFKGSDFIGSSNRVQDAYSLRCAPQIHGGVRDTVEFVEKVIEKEINAATDNPLIFDPEIALSGGNFHGEPIALVADYLSIAMSELGAVSERRIYRMTDKKMNDGLPAMLVDSDDEEGLNSGVMILQYTAASLTLENKTLASPDSIHSLPTSGGQEDHNANSMTAARHALQIVENLQHILSIELFVAARTIDLRKRTQQGSLGKINKETYDIIRSHVPHIGKDTLLDGQIEKVKNLLRNHEI
jgi:histidine ammonia-lyase